MSSQRRFTGETSLAIPISTTRMAGWARAERLYRETAMGRLDFPVGIDVCDVPQTAPAIRGGRQIHHSSPLQGEAVRYGYPTR